MENIGERSQLALDQAQALRGRALESAMPFSSRLRRMERDVTSTIVTWPSGNLRSAPGIAVTSSTRMRLPAI
jgi:hypothetical protein